MLVATLTGSVTEDPAPMGRVSVPEADRLIGQKHPVLTHGFVVLVDYMGNDAAIVQAARVSYGQGTKSLRDDRGLIRYLMRHRHTTPFEMVEFKFLVRLPIFVARQWIRHRTACLAEGTDIYFDLPSGVRRKRKRLYALRIEELWRRFQPSRNKIASRQRNPHFRRDRVQQMQVRNLDESQWVMGHTRIRDVMNSGPKPVFRVSLADGKAIECTADHRFLFSDGWHSLAGKTGLRVVRGRACWDSGTFQLFVNGTQVARPALHHDKTWLEDVYVRQGLPVRDIAEACGVGPYTVRRWIELHQLPRRETEAKGFQPGNQYAFLRPSRKGFPRPPRRSESEPRPYLEKNWLTVRWVNRGLTARAIALECHASPSTIRKWLRIHGLTKHPDHPMHSFPPGHRPWNEGRTYHIGSRTLSATHLSIIRSSRAGAASNFWKGGMSTDRESIGRWTTQIASQVHERNHWTCQLCHSRQPVLHAHHIVPVWADLARARDITNLTTLCDECHHIVHKDERAFVGALGGPTVITDWPTKPRAYDHYVSVPKLVDITGFAYVGLRTTYDVEVEGPSHNFIANGFITHNSVNEHSARYSVMPDEYELPPLEEIRYQSTQNRQGRGGPVPADVAGAFRSDLDLVSTQAYDAYTRAIEKGVARETARLILPVAFYTQWYWKTDLWNLLHFLSLRLDPHAQEEIRLYAAELAKIARIVCPVAYEAFEEYQLAGVRFSRKEQIALRALLEGRSPEAACASAKLDLTRDDGRPMKTGEGVEFLAKLDRLRQIE